MTAELLPLLTLTYIIIGVMVCTISYDKNRGYLSIYDALLWPIDFIIIILREIIERISNAF